MALGAFIAGRSSVTYDPPGGVAAADMGITEGGWEINARVVKEHIGETDACGGMIVDNIYRGIAEVTIQANGLEWLAGMLAALFPYGTAAIPVSGAGYLSPGVIARLDSVVAGVLIMTAVAGTPAATGPATLTATYTIITEESVRIIVDSKLRKLPGKWQILPYLDTVIKFYTFT